MFVQRNNEGLITATFANPQKGIPDEWIEGATVEATPKTRQQVETDRLFAYAHPVTGSDRFKTEYEAELAKGATEKAETAKVAWLARRDEIAIQNPWPKEGK